MAGAFDNLVELGQVCKKYSTIWFHVDGAYAGNSFILPEMRKFKNGIEYVRIKKKLVKNLLI